MRLTSLLVISALSSLEYLSYAFPLKPQVPPKQPAIRRRIAYSVVAVDGGSAATLPAAPQPDTLTLVQTSDSIVTYTPPTSSTPPSIETITATNIVSELEPAKTVDVTFTQDVTKIPSPTVVMSYIFVNPAETPTSSIMPLTSQPFSSALGVKCVTSFSTSNLTSTLSPISTSTSIPTKSVPLESSHRVSEAAPPAEAKDPEAAQSPSPHPTMTTSSTLPTATLKTYDDGMWHASYPMWNATSTVFSSASATTVGTGRVPILKTKS